MICGGSVSLSKKSFVQRVDERAGFPVPWLPISEARHSNLFGEKRPNQYSVRISPRSKSYILFPLKPTAVICSLSHLEKR